MKKFTWIVLCLCLLLSLVGCGEQAKPAEAAAKPQNVAVELTGTLLGAEGAIDANSTIELKNEEQAVLLNNETIITAAVKPAEEEGKFRIQLTLTEDGAMAFAEATKANLNKKIALYVNGKEIAAALVTQEINSTQVVFTADYNAVDSLKLYDQLV